MLSTLSRQRSEFRTARATEIFGTVRLERRGRCRNRVLAGCAGVSKEPVAGGCVEHTQEETPQGLPDGNYSRAEKKTEILEIENW